MFVSVVPRSLPLVLYPPKRMSVLQISVDAFSSQVFRLWMAEGANAKELPIYNQANTGQQEWHTEDGGKYCALARLTEITCGSTQWSKSGMIIWFCGTI